MVSLHDTFKFICQYKGSDGVGQFAEWYKDGAAINSEIDNHYVVSQNQTHSSLTITKLSKNHTKFTMS